MVLRYVVINQTRFKVHEKNISVSRERASTFDQR